MASGFSFYPMMPYMRTLWLYLSWDGPFHHCIYRVWIHGQSTANNLVHTHIVMHHWPWNDNRVSIYWAIQSFNVRFIPRLGTQWVMKRSPFTQCNVLFVIWRESQWIGIYIFSKDAMSMAYWTWFFLQILDPSVAFLNETNAFSEFDLTAPGRKMRRLLWHVALPFSDICAWVWWKAENRMFDIPIRFDARESSSRKRLRSLSALATKHKKEAS